MLSDYFKISFKGLKQRRLRSWLTMLGIFIGIATIVALMGLGEGLKEAVFSQFSFLNADVVTIETSMSDFGPFAETSNPLGKDEIDTLESIDGIEELAPRLVQSSSYIYEEKKFTVNTFSVPDGKRRDALYDIIALSIEKGEFLEDGDKYEIIVGHDVANNDAYKKPLDTGDKLTIEDKDFRIKGIMEKKGNFIFDRALAINEDVFIDIYDLEKDEYGIIATKVKKGHDIDEVIEEIERRLMKTRDVDEETQDFSVQSSQDTLEQMESTLFGVQLFIYIIAGISILVGGIGIMNTMFTSVVERTRDIGIMKAIGAKNSGIFTLFLIESGLLGTVGGVIGVCLGIGLGFLAEQAGNLMGGAGDNLIQAHFSPELILGAIFFSFIIGAFSGLWPAMRAAKMNPVDALQKTK